MFGTGDLVNPANWTFLGTTQVKVGRDEYVWHIFILKSQLALSEIHQANKTNKVKEANEPNRRIPCWVCPKCGTAHPITISSCCSPHLRELLGKPTLEELNELYNGGGLDIQTITSSNKEDLKSPTRNKK